MLVYAVHNRINGKHYIGKTERTLAWRWARHVSTARRGRGGCPYLGAAIRKYGESAFQRTVLFYAKDKAELNAAERTYILAFRSNEPDRGYNLTLGGEGTAGYKHTDKTRRKWSESRKGKPCSAEHRRKLSAARCGEGNPKAKLTTAQVLEIREEYAFGSTLKTLARNYGVTKQTVSALVNYKTWRLAA